MNDGDNQKKFRILSIDGGGIRGIYSATILEVFEKHFQTKIIDHFDMICGTSTGGIIAIALAVGFSAEQIVQFYYEKGPKIFTKSLWSTISQFIGNGKYGNKQLKQSLQEFFGDKKLKDASCYLCIPSFDLSTGACYVFKTPHHSSLTRDIETPLFEVALATSAAPIYFPVYSSTFSHGNLFVDGGIWANNPSLVGIVEALRFFVGKEKQFQKVTLVSVSNISEPFAKIKPPKNSILGWNKDIIDVFLAAQSSSMDLMTKFLVENLGWQYHRIPSPELSKEQLCKFKLDNSEKNILENLISNGNRIAHIQKQTQVIIDIFSTPKEISK